MHSSRAMEEYTKSSQMVFIDSSLFLIDEIVLIASSGLLLVVSHLFAVAVLVLWVGVEKNK
jgi:hypothetical protein